MCFDLKKKTEISQILLSLWLLIGDRTLCCPIQSVIVLVIKQIGLHTRIITGVSWCCGNYCLLAFVLWCGYCSVSFQSFVLRHWCPQHQETTIITDQIGLHSVLLPLFICFSLPQDLLEDPCPTVRATAIHGVCRITGVFWELIPAHVIKMFLTTLVRAWY